MAFNTLKQKVEERLLKAAGIGSIFIETEGQSIIINPDKKMRAASVIKLPILLEGYRQIDSGKISGTQKISLSKEELAGGSGVLAHLESVRQLSLHDILMLMIIVSDNTASNLAIKHLGMENVNEFTAMLGCTNTILGRRFMDFEATEKGLDNFTSARDMVLCLKEADTGKILSKKSGQKIIHTLKQQQLSANLHGRIDEGSEVSIASKSGSLSGVVNDVGIFELNGLKVYVAVLLDELPDNHTGQEIIADIGWYIYKYLHEIEKTC